MRIVARLLWTEPVLFLSAVAGVVTAGGGVAAVLGAPAWVALVCGVVGPAVAAAARQRVWSPRTHDRVLVAHAARHAQPPPHSPDG